MTKKAAIIIMKKILEEEGEREIFTYQSYVGKFVDVEWLGEWVRGL